MSVVKFLTVEKVHGFYPLFFFLLLLSRTNRRQGLAPLNTTILFVPPPGAQVLGLHLQLGSVPVCRALLSYRSMTGCSRALPQGAGSSFTPSTRRLNAKGRRRKDPTLVCGCATPPCAIDHNHGAAFTVFGVAAVHQTPSFSGHHGNDLLIHSGLI